MNMNEYQRSPCGQATPDTFRQFENGVLGLKVRLGKRRFAKEILVQATSST
jgi:hypothetical protein